MVSAKVPSKNSAEIGYVIEVIFTEFFGIDCDQQQTDNKDIELSTGDKTLIISNAFFSTHGDQYLRGSNIPQEVKLFSSEKFNAKSLPVLFGSPHIEIKENQVICGIDLIASIFFMLTRWEETISEKKDHYGRFPLKMSLAFKQKFYQRCIVNEYASLLWSILNYMNKDLKVKDRNFKFLNTYDIDSFKKWPNFKIFYSDLKFHLKKFEFKQVARKMIFYFGAKTGLTTDPNNIIDDLSKVNTRYKSQAIFFFMSTRSTLPQDQCYYSIEDAQVKSTCINLSKQGHTLGFHPSFNTSKNSLLMKKEIGSFRNALNTPVFHSRQHYLRVDVPETFNNLEESQLTYDSSLGYSEEPGFRCGTCYPFPLFDVYKKRKMNVVELPFICMDTTLLVHQKRSAHEIKEIIGNLIETVRNHKGIFVMLWHNNYLGRMEYSWVRRIHDSILAEYGNGK